MIGKFMESTIDENGKIKIPDYMLECVEISREMYKISIFRNGILISPSKSLRYKNNRIDEFGNIKISAKIRLHYNIQPGDVFRFFFYGSKIFIIPQK